MTRLSRCHTNCGCYCMWSVCTELLWKDWPLTTKVCLHFLLQSSKIYFRPRALRRPRTLRGNEVVFNVWQEVTLLHPQSLTLSSWLNKLTNRLFDSVTGSSTQHHLHRETSCWSAPQKKKKHISKDSNVARTANSSTPSCWWHTACSINRHNTPGLKFAQKKSMYEPAIND